MKSKYFNNRFLNADPGNGGGDDNRTEEQLLAKIQSKIDSALATRATKDELLAIQNAQKEEMKDFPIEALRAMADDKTGVMAMLAKQGLELTRLKQDINSREKKDMSIRSQVAAWQAANKDAIKEVRSGGKGNLEQFEINLEGLRVVNSPMLPSNTYGGSAYLPQPEFAPGIVDVPRIAPTFWDYLRKGTTGSAAYVWVNKKVPAGSGSAAFIGAGAPKPGVSFTLETEISNAKKIAVSEKMAIELLDDIDGMTGWVIDELVYQLYIKASTTLLDSVGSTTVPTGIKQLSVPYTLATVKTTNPNYYDCIVACVAQIRAGYFRGPITAHVNPIDMANMKLSKAISQGQLYVPPVTGATIVEDNEIPVGTIQIGCLDYYVVKIYKALTITWGLENDDFTKNLRTCIAEMRIHQYFSDNHTGSQINDTFADIVTAITAPVAP